MRIQNPRLALAAAGTSAALFLVYLLTLAPGLDFIDAGELATVAYTLGIAHPTGYPLFTMIGALWSRIPLGEPIVMMNALSAVLCAVAGGVFVRLLWHLFGLTRTRAAAAPRKGGAKASPQQRRGRPVPDTFRLALSVFGALTIGLSETYWTTALSVEVYALHILMLSLTLTLFATTVLVPDTDPPVRRWLLFCFVFGLAFTNHLTSILLVPAFAVAYFQRFGFRGPAWIRLAKGVPAFAAGLLPYVYLPLRAAAHPPLAWGNPATLERLLWHVSGKQYRVWIFSSTDAARKQFAYFVSTFPSEFAWIGLVLIAAGVVASFRRHRRLGVWLALLFAGCVAYAVNYDIHDIDSYFLLAYIAAGIWAAFGLGAVLDWAKRQTPAAVVGTAAVLVGVSLGAQWGTVSERNNMMVEDYTSNMLHSLKPGALVLSYQWDYWVSASYYFQMVRGARPDVVVIDKELLRRSWYYDQLRTDHPDVYRKSEAEIAALLPELSRFEHGEPYDPAVIEQRYNDVINSFVLHNIDSRPVYVTMEIEQHLAPGLVRVPEGLALRLYRPDRQPSPDDRVWDDFTWRPYRLQDRLEKGMADMYVTMLVARGAWLHNAQRYAQAAPYFERALRIDPASTVASQWRERNAAAMHLGAASSRVSGFRG